MIMGLIFHSFMDDQLDHLRLLLGFVMVVQTIGEAHVNPMNVSMLSM